MTDKKQHMKFKGEDIHWDMDMSYGQYLHLDQVLSAQKPLSGEHDEMLFIIIHQASELWMKLCIHELLSATGNIRKDDLGPSFKKLSRVARIQTQLLQSWEVLATMTPFDYMNFRDTLGRSSGFQSYQYRIIEFTLGHKEEKMITLFEGQPEIKAVMEKALKTPGIYDETLKLLQRRGFDIPKQRLERDWTQNYEAHKGVEDAWYKIYNNADEYFDLYELAEKLVDLEYRLQQWRFTHLKTVERIIGGKRGTGGTSGIGYLAKALSHTFFPELWTVRTRL